MSATSIVEDYKGRTARATLLRGIEYTRVFFVMCDAITDGPGVALTATAGGMNIPQLGTEHPEVNGARTYALVNTITPRIHQEHPRIYAVTVVYSTKVGDQAESIDPLERPPIVRWSSYTTYEDMRVDTLGRRVVNTAGVPLVPLPTREVGYLVLNLTFNSQHVAVVSASRYLHSVNSDRLMVANLLVLAYRARLTHYAASFHTEAGIPFWRVAVELQMKEQLPDLGPGTHDTIAEWGPWCYTERCDGYQAMQQEFDADGGATGVVSLQPIMLFEDQGDGTTIPYRPQEPLPLNSVGQARESGVPIGDLIPEDQQHTRVWAPYKALPYRELGLPPRV